MNDLRVYLAAAVCACHINIRDKGFRQKDVHFFFSLFSNWCEAYLGKKVFLQNTQVARYLEGLVKTQVLKKSSGKTPIYHCQDTGLLPLFEEIAKIEDEDHVELFFFQYHLLEIYHELMFSTVLEKKWHLPHGLKIELKYLLDRNVLVQKQMTRIQKEIDKLKLRSEETLKMEGMAIKMFKAGKNEKTVLEMAENMFPYQLNNQLRMTEFYDKILPNLRKAELTENARKRVTSLWHPMVEFYEDYLKRLQKLLLPGDVIKG